MQHSFHCLFSNPGTITCLGDPPISHLSSEISESEKGPVVESSKISDDGMPTVELATHCKKDSNPRLVDY